ncbi:MAG: sulfatase-like hydrolase/transferase [Methanophagales archaeon]|nr:sulfatase-like hydrolase/transferase [Methanophagales archaeon]
MVIITADHGEELGEHGVFLHPLEVLYDAQLHVPLIIYNAGYTGVTIDMPVNLIDISPTITDISGLPAAESFQGRSLFPVIKGERSITGVISESLAPQRCASIASYRTEQGSTYSMEKIAIMSFMTLKRILERQKIYTKMIGRR